MFHVEQLLSTGFHRICVFLNRISGFAQELTVLQKLPKTLFVVLVAKRRSIAMKNVLEIVRFNALFVTN